MIRIVKALASFFKLYFLLALITLSESILDYPPNIYIDSILLASGTAIGFLPNSNNTYNLNWRYPVSNISQSSVLLTNFQTTGKVISYKVHLYLNNQINSNFYFSPQGINSAILNIRFSFLLLQNSPNFLEIIHVYSPQTNNTYFNVQSSKFVFNSGQIIITKCLLSSISINAVISGSNYEKIRFYWSNVPFTSTISLQLYSNIANSNFVGIYVDIIIFSSVPSSYAVVSYDNIDIFQVPNSIFGAPLDNYCFFGFDYIQGWGSAPDAIYMFNIIGTSISSIRGDIFSHEMFVWCFAKCPPNTFVSGSSSYTCLLCSDYISYCQSCISSTQCVKCIDGFVLSPTINKCFRCSDKMQYCQNCLNQTFCTFCFKGNLVTGGCSDDSGCVEVFQVSSALGPSSTCVKCDQSMFYMKVNCNCKEGTFKAGSYCTTDIGCVNTIKIAGVVQCVLCDQSKYFRLNTTSKQCYCRDGFELLVDTCVDICGDGRVFTQPCDDGNTLDGDGCSSRCIVQSKYKCSHGGSSSPSLCQYIGRDLKINLIETQKASISNQGIFTFKFSPDIPSLSKMNLSHYFAFNCTTAQFSRLIWSYSEGLLTLKVDYQTDLQENQAKAIFSFNQSFVFQWNPIIVNFTIRSDGELLIISSSQSSQIILAYFLLGTCAVAVLLVVVGSWFHRMIGVELATTLQFVYYLHFTSNLYYPASSIFQYLSAVGLNNLFLQKTQQNFNSNPQFQKVDFSINQSERIFLGIFIGISVLGAVNFIFFVLFHQVSSSGKYFFEKITYRLFYDVLLPIALSVVLPVSLMAIAFSFRQISSSGLFDISLRSLLVLGMNAIIWIVLFIEIKQLCCLFKKKIKKCLNFK